MTSPFLEDEVVLPEKMTKNEIFNICNQKVLVFNTTFLL